MRYFYSVLFYLLLPLIWLRLMWRSLKASEYRNRWQERFGFYKMPTVSGVIWIHAVSVGEAEAVFPFVKKIQNLHPEAKLLITSTTPTGSARIRAVLGQSVQHVYLPYDVPGIVNRFMATFKPKLAIIMETEIWPNLFFYCGEYNIPLYLINARLSAKSASRYGKLPAFFCHVLSQVKYIAAQSQEDANRFVAIGANSEQIKITGNIKFDLEISKHILAEGQHLKETVFKDRYVWLTASTHSGEEEIFIEVFKELKLKTPELLLMIVPRHPERFNEVAELCRRDNLSVVTRTSNLPCPWETDIYLADTMGELKMLYAASDVAFVGGSMVPVGGHNILEALAIGVPVLFGPYMVNFQEIADKALARKAAIQCQDKIAVVRAIESIYSDSSYREVLIGNGKSFVQTNCGAVEKIYQLISEELS